MLVLKASKYFYDNRAVKSLGLSVPSNPEHALELNKETMLKCDTLPKRGKVQTVEKCHRRLER